MALARGDAAIRVVPDSTGSPEQPLPAWVIAIVPDADERVRLVRSLEDTPTLLVSRPEQAVAILAGAVPQVEAPTPARPPREAVSGLRIDSDARVVCWDGNRVALTPLEHDLLRSLSDQVGHVRTFEWLQEHVWGNHHPGNRSHVQSLVKRLRRKLHRIGAPLQIDAVRGVGLRLVHDRPGPSPEDVA